MPRVRVSAKDGKHLADYDVTSAGLNYTPDIEEAYALARHCAVDDGLVPASEAQTLRCELVQ